MRIRAILTLGLAGLMLMLFGSAGAASAAPYPPSTCPTLSVSTTEPQAGDSITVGGSSFAPNASVTIELHSTVVTLATVKTDATGGFSTTVTLPTDVTGTHQLVAVGGGTGASGCPANPSQTLNIGGAGVGGVSASASSSGTTSSSTGGTAFTGVNALLLLAVALVLVGAGVALNRRGKARVHH